MTTSIDTPAIRAPGYYALLADGALRLRVVGVEDDDPADPTHGVGFLVRVEREP